MLSRSIRCHVPEAKSRAKMCKKLKGVSLKFDPKWLRRTNRTTRTGKWNPEFWRNLIYLLPVWINPSQGMGQLLGSFLFSWPGTQQGNTKREEEHNHYTRGSKGLSNQYAWTNYRRFSLTCRGPIVWNNIPNNICDLRTFAQFKSAWRKYMTYVDQWK